jgi:HEPN domain-containing protein
LNKQKRNLIEGWLQKAFNQLHTAREHLKFACRPSESIQAAQECIELSVKAILSILNIQYSKKHGWEINKEEFEKIAKQISDANILEKLANENLSHIKLPRLIMLMNFWSQLYLPSKYGYSPNDLAPAKDLFDLKEAKLAVEHAEECYNSANILVHLSEDKLKKLL